MNVAYAEVNCSSQLAKFAYGYDVRLFRVSAQAQEARRGMIAALVQRGDSSYKQKLTECDRNAGKWCNLPMCPVCGERTLKSLIEDAAWLLLRLCDKYELPIIAIQHDLPDHRYCGDEFFDINMQSLKRSIRRQYKGAEFPLAFSGIQFSLIDDNRTVDAVWQAGVCSVIAGLPKSEVLRAIKSWYPDASVKRWRELDAEEALLSTIEPGWFREITRKTPDGSTAPRLELLGRAELRRLGHCFNSCKVSERYALTGCCVTNEGIKLNHGVRQRLKKAGGQNSRAK